MSKAILIVVSLVLIAGLLVYSYLNRDSDRVLLTLITALTLSALGFITKESISNKVERAEDEFSVVALYGQGYQPLRIRTPFSSDIQMLIQEIKPEDFAEAEGGGPDISVGARLYFDAFQYVMIQRVFETFNQGWQVKVRRFTGPGGTSQRTESLAAGAAGEKIAFAKVMEMLPENYFVRLGQPSRDHQPMGGTAIFPPGTTIELVAEPGREGPNTVTLTLKNRYVTVTVTFRYSAASHGIGDYERLLDLRNAAYRMANATFDVTMHLEQNWWLNGHPDMKAHRAWADAIFARLRADFDYTTLHAEHVSRYQLHGPQGVRR